MELLQQALAALPDVRWLGAPVVVLLLALLGLRELAASGEGRWPTVSRVLAVLIVPLLAASALVLVEVIVDYLGRMAVG